jgi:hypothetical protein
MRLVRGRFGTYEPIDFLALLIGYAISGELTLADFFERVEPFETAFMALFGRNSLPYRCHTPSSEGLERCPAMLNYLLHAAASMRSARLAIQGASEGKWSAHEPQPFRCIPVNGLAATQAGGMATIGVNWLRRSRPSLLRLSHFALSAEVALVRLDGQYGDAAVIAQIILAGVYVVTRGRGYQLLEHPQLQRALAYPPTVSVTRMTTGEVVELFEGGWLPTSRPGSRKASSGGQTCW